MPTNNSATPAMRCDQRRNGSLDPSNCASHESGNLSANLTLGMVRRGVAQAATLGYWMGAPHAGKGHMTRAVRAAAGYAFETLRLRRIEAACVPNNMPSIRLLEKVGFRREGYARQ